MNELKALMSCVCVSGTPRSEVQEEVECAPSPHLSLTLKVRPPQPGQNISISSLSNMDLQSLDAVAAIILQLFPRMWP